MQGVLKQNHQFKGLQPIGFQENILSRCLKITTHAGGKT
jgi:hypothetical protein